jgi:hypothetical protein
VSEKPLGMRHFWVFRARARQSWSPSSAAGVARDGKDGKNAPREAIVRIIDCGQEAKMEILVKTTGSNGGCLM